MSIKEKMIHEYFKNGGESFHVTLIDRYRDGVSCCGGTGTLIIETTSSTAATFIYNGIELIDKQNGKYKDANFKIYFISRIEAYLEVLKWNEINAVNLKEYLKMDNNFNIT